ncbi:EAL domain-containing protein [Halomonas sp. 18H]|nr:GGDEF domain-containing phosphodiesterase [Halomonas sp. 18H]MCW4148618.1 EAL domain-containing protein [Halomonas sp. 18H]
MKIPNQAESYSTSSIILEDTFQGIRQLAKNEQLAELIFSESQNAIMITDRCNRIIDVNAAFERITGYTRREVLHHNPNFLSSGRHTRAFYRDMWQSLVEQGKWRGELVNRRKDGELLPELLSLFLLRDGKGDITHHVAIFSDLTRLKKHAEELHLASHFDALTLLPNRHQMLRRIREAISEASPQTTFAVCVLDLDNFQQLNRQLGHRAADNVLIAIAEKLRERVGTQGDVARIGGDEFALLLHDVDSGDDQLQQMTESFLLEGFTATPLVIKASMGVTLFPLDNADPDILLRHADQAMYQAKLQGGNTFAFFDPDHEQKLKDQQAVREDITHAIKAGEFELHFQPQVDTQSQRLLGAEALIRWHHPKRGLVMPDQFLPQISGTEIELALDTWVLNAALDQLSKWHADGLMISVSINATPQSIVRESFYKTLLQALTAHPSLAPQFICIEVLESVALDDLSAATSMLNRLREIGLQVALDDFGTGYSSLSYLRNLPVDLVKIDRSFVMTMLESAQDLAIVESVTYLAKRFGKGVVAEGVESCAHIDKLKLIGCDVVQGYGVAKPMPAEELFAWSQTAGLPSGLMKNLPLT